MAAIGLAVLLLLTTARAVVADALPATMFIFGDSTADVGTNNFLPTSTFRADFPHNGVDFPRSKATGRFSNGLNTADFLAKLMGLEGSPPPFLSVTNLTQFLTSKYFTGINFASGGSGILGRTGQSPFSQLNSEKNVIPLGEQIEQFSLVRENLSSTMGYAASEEYLSKSIFLISIGSNDIFSFYGSNTSITEKQFLWALGLIYENNLKDLFRLGARKFGIVSVGPIGCCPSRRSKNANEDCVEELNDLAKAFHEVISLFLFKLSSEFKEMKYSLGNAFAMSTNVIENPHQTSFKDIKSACCGDGKLNAESLCTPNSSLCANRDDYLFWDLFHPSQAASKLAAQTLFNAGPEFVAPINFSQLAQA